MALSTFVKVGNITNLSDARYCAGMGVDEIGFCTIRDSSTYLSPEEASAIQGWVSGVKFVSEGIPVQEDSYEFDKVQIGIEEIQEQIQVPTIVEGNLSELSQAALPTKSIDYLLVVDEDKNELSASDKEQIIELASTYPVVLGFGFTAVNVLDILSELPLKGIAMRGSAEIRPGFKDYDELADILEQLELDD